MLILETHKLGGCAAGDGGQAVTVHSGPPGPVVVKGPLCVCVCVCVCAVWTLGARAVWMRKPAVVGSAPGCGF